MEQCVICCLRLTRNGACIKTMGVLQAEFNFHVYESYLPATLKERGRALEHSHEIISICEGP